MAYIVLRVAARIIGGWIGARMANVPAQERPWYGPALLAQAGVAVGMALVAAQEMPEHGELVLTLVIGTTVLFEIIGPVATALAVRQVAAGSGPNRGRLPPKFGPATALWSGHEQVAYPPIALAQRAGVTSSIVCFSCAA